MIGGYPGYVRSVDTAASPTEVTDWEYDFHGHDGHGSWRPAQLITYNHNMPSRHVGLVFLKTFTI